MRPFPAHAIARTISSYLRLVCLAAALGWLPAHARAAEDAPAGDGLSGHAIYQKVLANRFERFRQDVRLVSGDRAGNTQESRMSVLWKSFRDGAGQPVKGVLSKTIVRYTHPPLAAVSQPIAEVAARAAEMLIARNLGRPVAQDGVVVPSTFVPRASIAPPPHD